FLQKVVAAVRIRKGMDESSLESHVAYSAGQPKTPAIATGAAAVVDILRAAELLKEEGGNLVAIAPEPITNVEEDKESLQQTQTPHGSSVRVSQLRSTWSTFPRAEGVSLNIDIRIQCTAEDIEELGPKIRKMISELNRPEADDRPP
ncbi:MAG TPA: hypothetical protein VJ372_05840, partial [Pyrinomonadaceae bacterium]|nr:hypothetical protein [Pyrinomonadaceae bacterium]